MRSPFTDTITVYNRTIENKTPVWHRTVIRGVQWTQKARINSDATGKSVYSTETSITIPITADTGGSRYVNPREFTLAEDHSNIWTLNPETGDDVIVNGICPWNISEVYTLEDLKKEYGYVSIQAVADNTARAHLKNWKVAAN